MTKQDKTIKELKRVNHKLRSEMRMLEIRHDSLDYKYQSLRDRYEICMFANATLKKENDDLWNRVNKALEHIETEGNKIRIEDYYLIIQFVKTIKNILQGVDKE